MVEEVWQQTARADAERFLSFIYNTKQKADRKWGRGPDSHSCILPARIPLTASPNGTTRRRPRLTPKGHGTIAHSAPQWLQCHHHSDGCAGASLSLSDAFISGKHDELSPVYTLFCLSEFPKGLCCIFRIPTFSCTSPSSLTTSDFVSLSSLEFYHLISELA